jgi:hypothetical protein
MSPYNNLLTDLCSVSYAVLKLLSLCLKIVCRFFFIGVAEFVYTVILYVQYLLYIHKMFC